ncbi:MAG: 23S rRNA (uracil(1939)-C(5))-methyltransferase RlmD [Proteobacteria bacterium]|nr:23S rRNA (uracil(1939)-C(5))-methyltransferase RlmD [Pseudomonadota bacterium]MBT5189365.1 23S rRNA (uracil(1939)-C(5))-methyltransferase RlmD [Pseudomonadota bacterium]
MKTEATVSVETRIEDLSHDGRGVGRIEGKVWFVEGALPGETVSVKRLKGRRSYSTGVVDSIIVESTDRVTPKCGYFGICGGCAVQHLSYPGQLDFKKKVVSDAFIGAHVPLPDHIDILSADPWAYRRRARLGVRYVPKKGGALVGFRERNNSYITGLEVCEVLVKSVSDLLPSLRGLIEQLSVRDQLPQIEVAVGENATALVFRHLKPLTGADRDALAVFGELHQTQIFTQSKGPKTVTALWPTEPDPLNYPLEKFGLTIEFSPVDFVQINGEINERLVEIITSWLDLNHQDEVLDLFCGLGNFSLASAQTAKKVLGVEGEPSLVQKAELNAARNHIQNVTFKTRDLFDEGIVDWIEGNFSKVIVDPPRSGAREALKRVVDYVKPEAIAYVSCNPATLARDSADLIESGFYRLDRLLVADMFPHTAHVETAALFRRVS